MPTAIADFMTMVSSVTTVVTDGIKVFMTPPLVWYVALGFAAAGIGVAKGLVPKKKAK